MDLEDRWFWSAEGASCHCYHPFHNYGSKSPTRNLDTHRTILTIARKTINPNKPVSQPAAACNAAIVEPNQKAPAISKTVPAKLTFNNLV
jgi:hypothetical protein